MLFLRPYLYCFQVSGVTPVACILLPYTLEKWMSQNTPVLSSVSGLLSHSCCLQTILPFSLEKSVSQSTSVLSGVRKFVSCAIFGALSILFLGLLSHSCCLHTTSLPPWEMSKSEHTWKIRTCFFVLFLRLIYSFQVSCPTPVAYIHLPPWEMSKSEHTFFI